MKLQRFFSVTSIFILAWMAQEPLLQDRSHISSESAELPSARLVIDKYIQAIGGYEVLESRSTLHYRMKANKSGEPFDYEVFAADGRYYASYRYENGRVFERGFNNNVAWTRTNGVARLCEGDELKGMITRHRYVSAAPRWEETYKAIECLSIEVVNGRQALKLRFVENDETELERYFDVQSGLLVRSVSDESYNNGKRHVVRDYSDHKQMGEALVAQTLTTNSDGTHYTFQVEIYEVDIKIPEGTFDLPPSIARLAKIRPAK